MILRELFTRLGLDVDAKSFAKGALAAEVVKAGLARIVDVAEETARAFLENIKATAEYGHEIERTAQITGVATDALQRLQKGASYAGVGTRTLNHGLVLLSRSMAAAKAGGDDQGKAFRKVGVAYKDAHGQLRGADAVLSDLSTRFAAMPDGAQKTALAMQLLGRSGAELIPMLNLGGDELERIGATANVMTEEQIKAGTQLVRTQHALAAQTKALWRGAVAPLLPALNDLLGQYLAWKRANNEIMRQRLQAFMAGGIKAVGALGQAFSVAVNILRFFQQHVGLVAVALGGVLTVALVQWVKTATWAGARTAAAGAVATLGWTALAALLAGLVLVIDDVMTYQDNMAKTGTGGRTVFGRFKGEIDSWLQPKHDEPWFVTAIKRLVVYLEKALGLVDQLGLDQQTNTRLGNGAEVSVGAGGERVYRGGNPLALPFGGASDRTELSWPARIEQALGVGAFARTDTPTAPASTLPAGYGVMQIDRVEFHTTTQPGQDPAEFAKAQRAEWESWAGEKGFVGTSQLEGAAASSGG